MVVGFCTSVIIVVPGWFTGWHGWSIPFIRVAIVVVAAVSAVIIVAVVAVAVPVSTVVIFAAPIVIVAMAVVVVAAPVIVVATAVVVVAAPVVVVTLTSVLVPVPALTGGDVIVLPSVLLPIRFTTFTICCWLFVTVLSLTKSEMQKDKLIAPDRITFSPPPNLTNFSEMFLKPILRLINLFSEISMKVNCVFCANSKDKEQKMLNDNDMFIDLSVCTQSASEFLHRFTEDNFTPWHIVPAPAPSSSCSGNNKQL